MSDWVIITTQDWLIAKISSGAIADAFEIYGGSFVEAIWVALHRADRPNTIKILNTWINYVLEYIETFLLPQIIKNAK